MQGNVFEKEISKHKANICMNCDFSCEYGMEWTFLYGIQTALNHSWNGNSVMCVAIDPRVGKPRFHVDEWQLLFKGGFYLFFKENFCGFYLRAASIQGRLQFKKIW